MRPCRWLAAALLTTGVTAAQTTMLSISQSGPMAFGYSVANAGDLDRDGFPDVAIGCAYNYAGSPFVEVRSGRTGAVLWSRQGTFTFGASVAGNVDVDFDGVPDLLIGNPLLSVGARETGSLQVISGRTGTVVYQKSGLADERLGKQVAWVGDVDGDGIPDFAALAHQDYPIQQPGYVAVWSGRDGSLLLRLTTPFVSGPYSFAGVGDLNGDGRADIAVGLGQPPLPYVHYAPVVVFSGANGSILRVFLGDPIHSGTFGASICAVGDLDRDGVPDLVVADPGDPIRAPHAGRVWAISGASGTVLWWTTGSQDDFFGWSLAATGDTDLDGIPDVLVGATAGRRRPGYAQLLSGQNGSVLQEWAGDTNDSDFGFAVAAGDFNRDGHPDVVVGAPHISNPIPLTFSYVRVFSTVNATRIGIGCGAAPAPDLNGIEPHLGQPWLLQGSAPPGAAGLLFLGLRPDLPVALSPTCTAYLPLTRCFPLLPVAANASGAWNASVPVPYDTVLENVELSVQACLVPASPPPALLLTNGLFAGVRR